MLTEKLNIITSEINEKKIAYYQKLYSIAFRRLFNNLELMADPSFKKDIIKKYIFTEKNYEYLKKEVEVKHEQLESIRGNKIKKIAELKRKLKEEKDKKTIGKLQGKISKTLKSIDNNVTFGGKELLKTITKQSQHLKTLSPNSDCNLYQEKLNLLNKNKELFKEKRKMMMVFYGESLRGGNRYFDLSQISNGYIVFKYNNEKIKIEFNITNKKQKKLLDELTILISNRKIPITIGLSKNAIHLTYDEAILNGKHFNKKALYKKIKHIQDVEIRKTIIRDAHIEHEKKCFSNKIPNRFVAIDMNPDGIGVTIADRLSLNPDGDIKILNSSYIDFEKLGGKKITSNKRKYEISVAIKKLFSLIEHHKCCNFIIEDISNLSNKNYGNKTSNRKINNIWLRTYITELIEKHGAFYGIKLIKVNPVYSSFIGNLSYKIYDPIAASIELVRRGVVKYIKKGKLLPSFHKGVITDSGFLKSDKMDYNKLLNANSWKELYKLCSTAKMSVRRVDKNDYLFKCFKQNGTDKSLVSFYVFQQNSI